MDSTKTDEKGKESLLAPEEEVMDLLTVLQSRIGDFSYLVYNSVGVLQRDAPHIDEAEDKIINEGKQTIDELAKECAQKLVRANRGYEKVIRKLKEVVKSEEEMDKDIENLVEENKLEDEKLFEAFEKLNDFKKDISTDLMNLVERRNSNL